MTAVVPSRAGRRFGGVACLGAIVVAVIASFAWLSIDLGALVRGDSPALMAKFFREFFPPESAPAFLRQVGFATLQTLAVSALGTLAAAGLGALLALPASGRFGLPARLAARGLLNGLRSLPELVWAALMVLAAGIGPFAGTLALALHTSGVLGRLFAESLENAPPAPEAALREAGAPPVASFAYGLLPVVAPQGVAYVLYRWEMNIRMAAILGFVGGGGLGQMLYFHLSLFQQRQAATVLLAMAALVLVVDAASAAWRKAIAPTAH